MMPNVDKQIVAALDRLHKTVGHGPCAWKYNSKHDTYYCKHIVFPGREVITEVNKVNGWDRE